MILVNKIQNDWIIEFYSGIMITRGTSLVQTGHNWHPFYKQPVPDTIEIQI